MDSRAVPGSLGPIFLVFVLSACGDARAAEHREQLARFPKGKLFSDIETPRTSNRGLPDCLRLLAPAIGHGVCVPLDVVRPDGARDAPRWGRWTYEYVKTTQVVSADGEERTHFTDLEESRLGPEAQGEYERNDFVGAWTFWHPNGEKRAEGMFAGGEMSGVWSFWLADGSTDNALAGVYENGVRIPATRR